MKPLGIRQQLLFLLLALLALSFSSLLVLSRQALIYPATDQMAHIIGQQLRWLRLHCGNSLGNPECAPDLAVDTHRPQGRRTLPLAYHDRLRQRLTRLSREIDGIEIDEIGERLWLHTHWSDPYWLGFPLPNFAAKARNVTIIVLVISSTLALAVAIGYSGYLNRSLRLLSGKLTELTLNQTTGPPLRKGPGEMRLFDRLLDQLGRERQRLQQERTVMLLGISHDLCAPLARIAAAASLLEGEELRHDIEQDLGEIGQILEQFQAYVQHTPTPSGECVNLVKVIQPICRRYSNRGMDLRFITPPNFEEMEVKAIPLVIQRIVENLLQNGFKHGRPPVTVHLCRRDSHIEVVIRDRGDGIPAEALSAAVQPFVQIDPARGKEGSGLGLAIVQRELNNIGGTLQLQNHPLGGLEVSFSLPVWRNPASCKGKRRFFR